MAAVGDGRTGRGVMRGRADLQVGLAEHRRRGDEELTVGAQLGRPGARDEDAQLDVIVRARGAAHLADVAAGEAHLVADAQRARRRHGDAHVDAGAERAIGEHEHPADGGDERDDERGAGDAARVASRVVEGRAERHLRHSFQKNFHGLRLRSRTSSFRSS